MAGYVHEQFRPKSNIASVQLYLVTVEDVRGRWPRQRAEMRDMWNGATWGLATMMVLVRPRGGTEMSDGVSQAARVVPNVLVWPWRWLKWRVLCLIVNGKRVRMLLRGPVVVPECRGCAGGQCIVCGVSYCASWSRRVAVT